MMEMDETMTEERTMNQIMLEAGAFQYGLVDTGTVQFRHDVRAMCEVNTCRNYGASWACPPAVGTVKECERRVQNYRKMAVFSVKYDLEDSFDYEGMLCGMKQFKEVCRKVDSLVGLYMEDFLILANEGCDLCEKCTYPESPCRFPDKAHGSLEGYGIMVCDLAKQAGILYMNGKDTVTYFGAVIF